MIYMAKSNYQPVKHKQMPDAQEVLYSKDFKKADIVAGYRAEIENDANK